MTLENFSKLPDKETYDFKERIVPFKSDDAIDRFAVYQAMGIKKDGGIAYCEAQKIYNEYNNYYKEVVLTSNTPDHVDSPEFKGEADQCGLMKEIYKCLWGEDVLEICTSGDTMNSVNTTLDKLFAPHRQQLMEQEGLEKLKKVRGWSKRASTLVYYHKGDEFKKIIKASPGAEEFLRVSYTLGNFIPVPPTFQKRG